MTLPTKLKKEKNTKKTIKKKKKATKKGILGSGAAQKAHNKLSGRAAQLKEQERIAMGGKPKKKAKKKVKK